MGTSLINDALTNNTIENGTEVNVIFVSKNKEKNKHHGCYIDDFWSPINFPFTAMFTEERILTKIKEDINTKALEAYFGVNLDRLVELVTHKPRNAFNEHDDLFFTDFNINPLIYEDNNYPTFMNCKEINNDFELIKETEIEEVFEIQFNSLMSRIKMIFTFNKRKLKLTVNVLHKQGKADWKNYDELHFFDGLGSYLRQVFQRFYQKQFPVFTSKEVLEKVKEIESLSMMIFATDIKNFIPAVVEDQEEVKKNIIGTITDLKKEILERKNNKDISIFATDIYSCLSVAENMSIDNIFPREMKEYSIFFKLYFGNLGKELHKNFNSNLVDEYLDIDFIESCAYYMNITIIMNYMNLEFRTYMYAGRKDLKLELKWHKHCKQQSKTIQNDYAATL